MVESISPCNLSIGVNCVLSDFDSSGVFVAAAPLDLIIDDKDVPFDGVNFVIGPSADCFLNIAFLVRLNDIILERS